MLFVGPTKDNLTGIRPPTTMRQNFSDIDSSSTTRTASGKMVRSVVRGGYQSVRKLELTWELLPEVEARTILRLMRTSFFYMQYPDILTGEVRTVQFYAGDKAVDVKRVERDGKMMIENLSINVIER